MRRLERFAISGRFALLPAVAAAMATVAAAAAFACTPQAYMSLDRQAYSPGDRVTIRGHLFDARSEIPVTVRAGADGVVLGQRRIARDGSWTLSFRLPRDTAAGSYLITAHAPGSYREIVGLTPEETAQAPWPAVRLALPVGLPAATRDNGAQRLKDALPRPQERPERADSRVRENARAGENDAKGSGRSPGPAEPGKSSAARPGATVSPTPAGARPTATVSPRPRGRVTPSDAGERARPDSSRPALRLRPAEPADSWATPSTARRGPGGP